MALVTGDPTLDFFEQNPTLKVKSEFKKLLETHSKEEASKICWAIFLIEETDQSINKLARMSRDERIKEVHANFYNLDTTKYRYLMDAYSSLVHTLEETLFKIQIDKMDELTSFYKRLKFDKKDEFDKFIKITDKLPKAWEGVDKAKKRMIESQNKSRLRGGASQSARERRK